MRTISIKNICLCICLIFSSIAAFGQKDSNDTRTGHTATINHVAFSPDGKFLASASSDHTIQIWEIRSGKIVLKIDASESVYAVAFSPDGKLIAGGTSEKVKLWDAKTGKQLKNSEEDSFGNLYVATSIAFSSDGKLLAAGSGGEGSEVVVWDIETGEESYRLAKAKSPIAFNKSGTRLATASGDDLIKIWDVESGDKIRTIEGAGVVVALAFNPNGRTIASIGGDEGSYEIKSWSVADGKQQEDFSPEIKPHGGFAFAPDGQSIIVADKVDYSAAIKSLDAETGAEQEDYGTVLAGFGDAFALSADGKMLAFSDSSGLNVAVLDLEAKEEIAVLKGHSVFAKSLAFSRDGKTLTAAYTDGSIAQWNAENGQLKKYISVKESERSVSDKLFLNSDGGILTTATYNQIDFYDIAAGEVVSAENSSLAFGDALKFSSDSKTLAAGGSNDITLYEVSSGRTLQKYDFPAALKNSADSDYLFPKPVFGKDGKFIAGVAKTGIVFWNLTTGKILRTIKKDFGDVAKADFSPNGKILVISTTYPHSITVVNAATGATIYKLEAHDAEFDISADGKILASSVSYEKLALTDLVSGKMLRAIKTDGEIYTLSAISFSPNNLILAVSGDNGITLYKTATGEKIRSMK